MGAVVKLFLSGVNQVFRDGMLLLLLPAPFLIGAVLRLGLPFADDILIREIGFTIQPWFALSDAFVMVMTTGMFGMIGAFLLLDERDEGIGLYYRITPAGGYAYLAARLGVPMIWAFIASVLVIRFLGLALGGSLMVLGAGLATLQGIIACMLLSVVAGNKVEGLALAKMVNILILALPVPWFIAGPYKYVLGFLPSFWMGEAVFRGTEGGVFQALLPSLTGTLLSVAWIVVFTRSFLYKTDMI